MRDQTAEPVTNSRKAARLLGFVLAVTFFLVWAFAYAILSKLSPAWVAGFFASSLSISACGIAYGHLKPILMPAEDHHEYAKTLRESQDVPRGEARGGANQNFPDCRTTNESAIVPEQRSAVKR